MAITNGYLTLAEALSELQISDANDDAQVERAVEAASRLVDEFCGQRFWQDGSPSTRYFTPSDPHVLWLRRDSGWDVQAASLTSVTSVSVDEGDDGTYELSWTEDTEYYLAPRGAGASGEPYTKLRIPSTVAERWPVGYPDSVKVVGTFGWPAVPQPVKEACAIQTQVIFKRITEGAAPIVTMDGTTLSGSRYMDMTAQLLLRPYRRAVAAY